MAYSGSCMDMCPESERRTRFGAYVSIFECDKNNQPDESSMVKAYRRSGADQEEPAAEDLRTHQALENTMNHLVSTVMNDPRSLTPRFSLDWYDFLWDRLRAIRKDITQQNICDQASAILVEKCARFHVHSCYAMNRVKDFDADMNKRNLNDCLQMLRQMYTDLKTSHGIRCPGELEFQIYDLLLHLDEDHLSSNIIMKTSEYRTSKEMSEIIRVFSAYTSNNYHRYFKFMKQADYMTSCLLSLYANKMRLIGMRMIASACPSRQSTLYPMDNIINLLGFDDVEDVEAFASVLEMTIQKTDKQSYVVLNKELVARLRRPDLTLPPFKSRQLVEDKMHQKQVGQLIQNKMDYEQVDRLLQSQMKREQVEEPDQVMEMQYEEQVDSGKLTEVSCDIKPGPRLADHIVFSTGGIRRVKRTKPQQKRQSTSAPGYSIKEIAAFVEEKIIEAQDSVRRPKLEVAATPVLVNQAKQRQETVEISRKVSSDTGQSKLTINNLRDEDYGQCTCRPVDLGSNQSNINTLLNQQQEQEKSESKSRLLHKKLLLKVKHNMDEVIEVKEGDFNIELGIQILPELNDDEELMSEEEKAEFVANTSITWFKDDAKLDQNDAEVQRLFQFTYDQTEGFHRLIVRKATKETEGVYTCLVENESGTSSCSTQLVVGLVAQAIEAARNYAAMVMPAGKFRKCSLENKRPTLRLPPTKIDETPTKRRRNDEKRKSTDSIRSRIESEEKVNKILAQLASMIAG